MIDGFPAGHFGMSLMRERADLAGGSLEIESLPVGGTKIEFWLPNPPGLRSGPEVPEPEEPGPEVPEKEKL